jgi:hypothetical protein
MVYVELEDGAKLEEVTAAIKADPYFASDETHVFQVESVDDVRDMGHGVNLGWDDIAELAVDGPHLNSLGYLLAAASRVVPIGTKRVAA